MFTIIDKTVKIAADADISQFPQCPNKVYDAWIKRVHDNGTHVNVGDSYMWFYVQVVPPKWISCVITVRPGDQYPLTVTS